MGACILSEERALAELLSSEIVRCDCSPRCPTKARIKEWDCGCVEVFLIDDTSACSGCSDFSGMRRHCGKNGRPRG